MEINIISLPRSEAEKAKWPARTERCRLCSEIFGYRKLQKLDDGTVVHRNCQGRGD